MVRRLEISKVTLLSDSRSFPLRRFYINHTIWLLCHSHEWSDKVYLQLNRLQMISVTQYGEEYLTVALTGWIVIMEFPQMERKFSEFSEFVESDKLLKHELESNICLARTVVASWSLTQEVAGSNPFAVMRNILSDLIQRIQWKHSGKTQILTTPVSNKVSPTAVIIKQVIITFKHLLIFINNKKAFSKWHFY